MSLLPQTSDGIATLQILHIKRISHLVFLRRNLRINSPSLKSVAYKSLVRPLLEYSSAAWDAYTKDNVKKLEMVQRRAARYVLNRYHNTSSVSEMLQELQWDTLEERRKRNRLSIVTFYQDTMTLIILA